MAGERGAHRGAVLIDRAQRRPFVGRDRLFRCPLGWFGCPAPFTEIVAPGPRRRAPRGLARYSQASSVAGFEFAMAKVAEPAPAAAGYEECAPVTATT